MTQTEQTLRSQDLKVTPQRLAVYSVLEGHKGHFSVEEIYQSVRLKVPAISLGTVYAILENLTAKGLVNEIKIDFEKSFYEKADHDHHHFLCHECKKILDVEMPSCTILKCKSVQGHTIESFQGYFYGTCKDCKMCLKGKKGQERARA
jgi:Fe2+ or Zn2+ uptake regulation protein